LIVEEEGMMKTKHEKVTCSWAEREIANTCRYRANMYEVVRGL
jgi:hypothetical protein